MPGNLAVGCIISVWAYTVHLMVTCTDVSSTVSRAESCYGQHDK